MKEIVYKKTIGNNPVKHEISMEEITNWKSSSRGICSGDSIAKKKICKYFIKDRFSSEKEEELKNWISAEQKKGCRRDCHVLRYLDTRTGENKIVCKVLGEIFVLCPQTAYKVLYINEIKVEIFGPGEKKKRFGRG